MAKRTQKIQNPFSEVKAGAEATKAEITALQLVVEHLNTSLNAIKANAKALKGALGGKTGNNLADMLAMNDALAKAIELQRQEQAVRKANNLTLAQRQSAEQSLQRQRERSIAQNEREIAQAERLARKIEEQNQPYNRVNNALKKMGIEYQNLAIKKELGIRLTAEETARMNLLETRINRYNTALRNVDQAQGKFGRNVGNYTESIQKGFRGALNALSQFGFALGGIAIAKSLITTEINLRRLRVALKNVIPDTDEYNQSLKFLSTTSKKYGQDLEVLTDTYKNFIASSQASGLQLNERQRIYESIIKSGSALALSNDQIQGSLLAVSQMFSKGKVSAEELRGQLGERLPGAFGLMAKALKVSEAELGKMLETGQVLAKDALPLLANELEKAYGDKAQANLQTVGGAWNVLKTNISEYVSSANESGSVTKKLADLILFLGQNISTIIKTAYELVKVFVIFKTVMKAMELGKAFNEWRKTPAVIESVTESVEGLTESAEQSTGALGEAETAGSKFGKALKAIGWAVLIDLALQLAQAFYSIASGAKQAEVDSRNLENALKQGEKRGTKNIKDAQKERDSDLKSVRLSLKNKAITKEEALKQELKITQQYNDKINNLSKQSSKKQQDNFKAYQENTAKINAIRAEVGDAVFETLRTVALAEQEGGMGSAILGVSNSVLNQQAKILGTLLQKNSVYKAQQQGLKVSQEAYNTELSKSNEELGKNTRELNGNGEEHDKNTKKLKDAKDEVNLLNEALKEQVDLVNENALSEFEKDFASALKTQLDGINQDGEYSLRIINDLTRAEKARRLALINDNASNQIDVATTKEEVINAGIRRNIEISKLDEEFVTIELDALDQIEKAQEEKGLNNLARREAIHQAKIAIIDREVREEELLLLNSKLSNESIAKEQKDSQIISLEEKIKLEKEYGNDTLDLEIELAKLKRDLKDKELEEDKKYYEKLVQFGKKSADELLNYQIKKSQEKQKIIDSEISDSEKQSDLLAQKASQGNLLAEESLKKQQEITNKYRDKRQREEEREQRLEQAKNFAEMATNITNSLIQKGGEPIGSAGKAIGLVGAIKALFGGGFKDGTDMLGDNGKGLDGQGGRLILAHKKERIMTEGHNQALINANGGKLPTNDYVVKAFQLMNSPNMILGSIKTTTDTTHAPILKEQLAKLDEMSSKLDRIPNEFFSKEMIDGVLTAVHTKKVGNTINKRYIGS
jgi:tape measure domain-containing protein